MTARRSGQVLQVFDETLSRPGLAEDLFSVIGQHFEQTCRGCGCHDDRACLTGLGPCSWVMEDLCSECWVNPPAAELELAKRLYLGATGRTA